VCKEEKEKGNIPRQSVGSSKKKLRIRSGRPISLGGFSNKKVVEEGKGGKQRNQKKKKEKSFVEGSHRVHEKGGARAPISLALRRGTKKKNKRLRLGTTRSSREDEDRSSPNKNWKRLTTVGGYPLLVVTFV